jgi:hypothetical protein
MASSPPPRALWAVLKGLAFLLLLAVAVPWYWPRDDPSIWFGVPRWVVVAVGASAATSLLTAWLLRRPWPDEERGA